MDIRKAVEDLRNLAGIANRSANKQIVRKVDDLQKHGDHDQSTHGRSGAQRYNENTDRMMGEARRLEVERLSRGEKPNPNLTDVVSSRTHIAGEHKIYQVGSREGESRYVTAYKPSPMFQATGESERPLGTHGSLKDAENRVQEHKDSLIADWNARARNKSTDSGNLTKHPGHGDQSVHDPRGGMGEKEFEHYNEDISSLRENKSFMTDDEYKVETRRLSDLYGKTEDEIRDAAEQGIPKPVPNPDVAQEREDESTSRASRQDEEMRYADPDYNPSIEERYSKMAKLRDAVRNLSTKLTKNSKKEEK